MTRRVISFETEFGTYSANAEPLGQGGSGVVYRATGGDGEQYAIKVLDPKRATSSKVKRFANELNFGRRIRHDHIVPVIDSGIYEKRGQKTSFFVMPRYVSSFRMLIDGGLSPERALQLFDGVLSGVEFAHSRGVWHRDLKPENILYDGSTDRLLLADFGIAHFEEEDLLTAVETNNERLANFVYAAPEQRIKGGAVDHRADIYALGLILNESITRSLPLGAGYTPVAAVAPRHAYVDGVVARMIQSAPDKRYPSTGRCS